MDYVEFRRVRRALTIYAIFLFIGAIVAVVSFHNASMHNVGGNVIVSIDSGKPQNLAMRDAIARLHIPLALLLGLAGWCAVVMATVFASSLNKENDGANFVFVKPISRERLALQYMAIDLTGIASAFVLACAAIFGSLAAVGWFGRIVVDAQWFSVAALGLGIAFMWYGIMQAVTASYRGKGGALVGWSWAIFGGLSGMSSATFLGPVVVAVARVLNVFNPIAYFSGLVSSHGAVRIYSLEGLPIAANVGIAWSIGLIGCALATRLWKRVEV